MKNFIQLSKWFNKESYSYNNPNGFIEHMKYFGYYPIAYVKFKYYSFND